MMKTHTSIVTLAAIATLGAIALATPSQAQLLGAAGNATAGVSSAVTPPLTNAGATTGNNGNAGAPNFTMPTDSVRRGAAGINAAEATRTTGNAARDAEAAAENQIARTGTPDATASASIRANAAGQNAKANTNVNAGVAANDAAQAADAAANRSASTAVTGLNGTSGAASNAVNSASSAVGRKEEALTQQLNRKQGVNATVSGSLSTR
jgi:hypothetical protein